MSRRIDFPHEVIPEGVVQVCARLREAGYRAWIVGGCVRDLLLGRAVQDWDVASSALPQQVQKVFRRVIPTGIDHGTVTVLLDGEGYEVTTLRGDGAYSDGRRPDEVFFVQDIAEDLARRDFTVNAIAYEPIAHLLVDPHGGLADVDGRLLRAVGDPAKRFAEDGLRILRGARFVATLDFELEAETEAAFRGALDVYAKVSPERIREEWLKAMKAERPSRAFEVMERTGILGRTCPPLAELKELPHPGPAGEPSDLFELSLRALDASTGAPHERVAALLHRVGRARGADPGAHARTSADLVEGWFRDYRFSNAERKDAVHAIGHHLVLMELDASNPVAVRRFLSDVGRSGWETVLRLAQAVAAAEGHDGFDAVAEALATTAASSVPLAIGDLAIGGAQVIEALGGGGRKVGLVLRALLERTLEQPALNDEATLRSLIPAVVEELDAPVLDGQQGAAS